MKLAALALPALLAACDIAGDCLPAAVSPEREEFRQRLRGLVHLSQCPGLPTPKALAERVGALDAREQAFLARVRKSRLSGDLEQAIREDEEWSRNVHEAECALYPDDYGETAKGREEFEGGLREEEAQLTRTEALFVRLNARCIGS